MTQINKLLYFEKAKSAVAIGFHAGPLSWSNWSLEVWVLVEGGNQESSEKNPRSKARTNNHMTLAWNRTRAILVGGYALTTAPHVLLRHILACKQVGAK